MKPVLKPYQKVDQQTGEIVSAIKYVQGHPLNIRFNGQNGQFSRDGEEIIGDSIEITPIAWRFFSGELFNRSPAEYAEVFYVDKQRNLCVVLFTNASAQNLKKYMANLSYNSEIGSVQTMMHTTVLIKSALRIRKDKQRYYVAEFRASKPADVKATTAFFMFCRDHKVYRADTRNQPGGTNNVEDIYYSTTYLPMWGLGVRQDSQEDSRQIQESY